jgi:hypothetical protein
MTKTPGLDQSQALTRAAQKLSAARKRYDVAAHEVGGEDTVLEYQRASDVLENAELAYKAAFKAYTNPFGVEKTHG